MIRSLILVLALLVAIPAFGKKLPMRGRWKIIGKSLVANIPIIGDVDETSGNLTLEFVGDLGNVMVTVTDGNGNTVYQESVETGATPNLTISLGELTDGTVTVTWGEFSLWNV